MSFRIPLQKNRSVSARCVSFQPGWLARSALWNLKITLRVTCGTTILFKFVLSSFFINIPFVIEYWRTFAPCVLLAGPSFFRQSINFAVAKQCACQCFISYWLNGFLFFFALVIDRNHPHVVYRRRSTFPPVFVCVCRGRIEPTGPLARPSCTSFLRLIAPLRTPG